MSLNEEEDATFNNFTSLSYYRGNETKEELILNVSPLNYTLQPFANNSLLSDFYDEKLENINNTSLIDAITSSIVETLESVTIEFTSLEDKNGTLDNFNSSYSPLNGTVSALNGSEGNSTEIPLPIYSESMLGFTAFCAFTIAIFGTFGNLLTVIALPLNKKLRTTNTAFVVNLAFVELCYCVFILPLNGIQFAYLQHTGVSILSDFDCIFATVTRYTFTQVDIQTIIAIAVFRAVAVGCPSFYQKINNMTVTMTYIACIWIYSFALKVPTGLGIFGRYVFNYRTLKCDLANERASIKARVIALFVEAFIPILVVILLYTFIFIMVRRSTNRVGKSYKVSQASSSSAKPSISMDPEDAQEDVVVVDSEGNITKRRGSFQALKRMASDVGASLRLTRRSSSITNCIATNRRDMRVARSIFIIFVVLLLCSVPVAVNHATDTKVMHPNRLLAIHILYWLQYCLNSVIYVFMNRQYRDAYVEFLARFRPSWKKHQGFSFPWELPSTSHVGTNLLTRKKSSSSTDPRGKETTPTYKKTEEVVDAAKQHRLSAIIEANSSNLSDDDVFPKDIEKNGNVKLEFKENHSEEGTEEEKQLWLNKNGSTEAEPDNGVVV